MALKFGAGRLARAAVSRRAGETTRGETAAQDGLATCARGGRLICPTPAP